MGLPRVGRRPLGESFCTRRDDCSNALVGIVGVEEGELMEGAIVLCFLAGGGLSDVVDEVIVRTRWKFNAWVGGEIIRVPKLKLRITSPRIEDFGKCKEFVENSMNSGVNFASSQAGEMKEGGRLKRENGANIYVNPSISSIFGFKVPARCSKRERASLTQDMARNPPPSEATPPIQHNKR
jgi:hypothetical protein